MIGIVPCYDLPSNGHICKPDMILTIFHINITCRLRVIPINSVGACKLKISHHIRPYLPPLYLSNYTLSCYWGSTLYMLYTLLRFIHNMQYFITRGGRVATSSHFTCLLRIWMATSPAGRPLDNVLSHLVTMKCSLFARFVTHLFGFYPVAPYP